MKNVVAKPFVKWAGGKGNLLQKLETLLPNGFDELSNVTYIEPFIGGGAMLFHMLQNHRCIKRAVINDINPDLIHCYELVAKNPRVLIELLKTIEYSYFSEQDVQGRKRLYYVYRDLYNSESISSDERAAFFIFLNHTCFNGLFRVNTDGKFNVPYGRYKCPVICNEELIYADHHLLNSIELIIRKPGDYKWIRRNLSRQSPNFIYFDPPYRPLYGTSNFKEYYNAPFGDKQQYELKDFCDKLSHRGCYVMQSNSDSRKESGESFFEELYGGYNIKRLCAPRFINAKPENRLKWIEVVIRNY